MSAAKIMRHLPDTVNYPLRFSQSRTRIKFEYMIINSYWMRLSGIPRIIEVEVDVICQAAG